MKSIFQKLFNYVLLNGRGGELTEMGRINKKTKPFCKRLLNSFCTLSFVLQTKENEVKVRQFQLSFFLLAKGGGGLGVVTNSEVLTFRKSAREKEKEA